jgi:hypothetical protein
MEGELRLLELRVCGVRRYPECRVICESMMCHHPHGPRPAVWAGLPVFRSPVR